MHREISLDAVMMWVVLIAASLLVMALKQRKKPPLDACGTARFANDDELRMAKMLGAKDGLIIGRTMGEPATFWTGRKAPEIVRLSQAVHTSVFAPTGVGKGVSCIIPFLLTCEDSCVIVDVKDGELARLTAEHRRRMGQEVILLDPGRIVTQRPATLNVIDGINRNSPRAVNEAAGLANALVIRTGEEKEPHWNDRAEAWLSALIATTVWYGKKEEGTRSLLRVAEILSNQVALKTALGLMQELPEIWNGSLARMGGMLTHSAGEELASTMSTVGRFVNFMNSPSVAESLKSSNFDLSKLRRGRMSIYLIQRAEDTRTGSPLIRLWLNACMREVMRGGLNQKNNAHVVIDEADSVGRMDCISDALNVGRGFGLRLQLYYQDVGQLNKCWENPNGVLSNTTSVWFGVSDYQSAQNLSARLGNQTIIVESGGSNSGSSRSWSHSGLPTQGNTTQSWGRNDSWQQQQRALLTPDELMALPQRIAITFVPGMRPILTTLLRYYEENLGKKVFGNQAKRKKASWKQIALVLAILYGLIALMAFMSQITR